MSVTNQEGKNSTHVVVNATPSVAVSHHNPDGQVGSNTNAGSPADNPIQNSLQPAKVLTVAGVRFANPA